jgi:DNA-binding winged helix-turn-helix (wHTH) protein
MLSKINKIENNVIQIGPVIIDPMKLRAALIINEKYDKYFEVAKKNENVELTEKELDLTPIEFKILISLLKLKGQVVSRVILNQEVWGKNMDVGERVVDQHVSSLRKKIKPYHTLIQTVYGVGYRFQIGNNSTSVPDLKVQM